MVAQGVTSRFTSHLVGTPIILCHPLMSDRGNPDSIMTYSETDDKCYSTMFLDSCCPPSELIDDLGALEVFPGCSEDTQLADNVANVLDVQDVARDDVDNIKIGTYRADDIFTLNEDYSTKESLFGASSSALNTILDESTKVSQENAPDMVAVNDSILEDPMYAIEDSIFFDPLYAIDDESWMSSFQGNNPVKVWNMR